MKFGVIVFPGSNCDHDAYWTIQHVCKEPATFLWHESHDLENCDAVIVPGGFAYGDYLRTGAIAKFSPGWNRFASLRMAAGWCSASATGSRFFAKRDFCQERCCATWG